MLNFARANENSPLENFTTEALASAVDSDPRPLLAALDRVAVEVGQDPVPETQVHVPGVGNIDLVLQASTGQSVWFEIKVNSGLSGDQLDRYRGYLSGLDKNAPALVLLSPHRLDPGTIWLPWQHLWEEIGPESDSPQWRDIRRFLEEIGMADAYNESVSAHEADALALAHSARRKMGRLLLPVSQHLDQIWPSAEFPTLKEEVDKMILNQFSWHGQFAIHNRVPNGPWLHIGLRSHGSTRAELMLWVTGRTARDTAFRTQVHDLIKSGGSSEQWRCHYRDSLVVDVAAGVTDFSSQDNAADWCLARISELEAIGVLEKISVPR